MQLETQSASENTPQLLLSLLPIDPRAKYYTEESVIPFEALSLPYIASCNQFSALEQFIESLKVSSNSIPCKIIHIEYLFDQPILLEVLHFLYNSNYHCKRIIRKTKYIS